jgi:hypothetical protein
MGPKASLEHNSTLGLETISDRFWIGVNVDPVLNEENMLGKSLILLLLAWC